MIEPTDEMEEAMTYGGTVRERLAAVLAIVERDYPLMRPCPTGENGRCLAVAHSASNARLCRTHGCVYPGTQDGEGS
jgi:hypothetical protein